MRQNPWDPLLREDHAWIKPHAMNALLLLPKERSNGSEVAEDIPVLCVNENDETRTWLRKKRSNRKIEKYDPIGDDNSGEKNVLSSERG